MDLELAGKVVVITGGSGGIGRGLVMEFAREGAHVVSASRDAGHGEILVEEAKAQGFSGKILPISTDITDRASVDAMVEKIHASFGLVDVLVNNAGGLADRGPLEKIPEAARKWEIALNIDGVINCTQAVAEDMLSRRNGSVINISSTSALAMEASYHNVHYAGVKGFVNSFTRGLANEWADRGVRVNDIAPGWTVPHKLTDVGKGSAWYRIAQLTPEQMQQNMEEGKAMRNASRIPLGRLGRPEDIAYLTLFLASDRSSYITGQRISVNGGTYMP